MSRVRVLASVAVVLACALVTPLKAQTRPSLAGTWTLAPERSIAVPGSLAREITVSVDGQSLTLAEASTRVYTVDGAEHSVPVPAPNGGVVLQLDPDSKLWLTPQSSSYRAVWTRDQLVIMMWQSATPPGGGATIQRVTRRAFSIDADGMLLIDNLVLTDPLPDGPTQPAPMATKAVYRRPSSAKAPPEKLSFTGMWRATQFSGVTAARIFEQDGRLQVQLWGSCRPTDCDWGVAPFSQLSDPQSQMPDRGFAAYSGRYAVFRLDGPELVIEVYGVPEAGSTLRSYVSAVRLARGK